MTAVGAFDAVGSVLVVALMIAPPAAAYLLSDRLGVVLLLSAAIAALSAVSGFWVAWWVDASIAGCMAAAAGVFFLLALLFAPARGLVAGLLRRHRQRFEFAQLMLAIHLLNHQGTDAAAEECSEQNLPHHLRWDPPWSERVVRASVEAGWVERRGGLLHLTGTGREAAISTMGS